MELEFCNSMPISVTGWMDARCILCHDCMPLTGRLRRTDFSLYGALSSFSSLCFLLYNRCTVVVIIWRFVLPLPNLDSLGLAWWFTHHGRMDIGWGVPLGSARGLVLNELRGSCGGGLLARRCSKAFCQVQGIESEFADVSSCILF